MTNRYDDASPEARELLGDFDEIDLAEMLATAKNDIAACRAQEWPQRLGRAEVRLARVTALYEQWVKAGPPPLGVPLARWWDRRLVELHEAIHPAAEQPARTTAETPAATEATDTWKEPTHPHPCTATIEGRATPAGRQVQCTREARHPENHVGPKQGANGRVLWTDHQAGATPHKETP